MPSAIPKGLVSREMLTMTEGVRASRNTLLPVSVGPWTAAGNNKILFSIPSYRNSFVDTKRSYLRFDFQLNSAASRVFRNSVAPFRRMVVRDSRGQILEDVTDYATLCKLKDVMKTEADLKSQLGTTRSNYVVGKDAEYTAPVPVIHKLQSGLLGEQQQFYIPLNQLMTVGGFALQVELTLADDVQVCYSTDAVDASYQISNCAWEMELLELSDELMRDVNGELRKGKQISIPYKSVRTHIDQMATGRQFNLKIHESAHNIDTVMSVIRQAAPTSQTSISNKIPLNDPYTFYGGSQVLDANSNVAAASWHLTKYSFKVANKFYPNAPVEMESNKALALQNAITTLDLKEPFLGTPFEVANGFGTNFELRDFCVVQSFKATSDPNLQNGLNLSATAAPIELNLEFNSGASGKECVSFIEQQNTLFIKGDGSSSVIKG
jgi:hypothetical protein